VENVKMKTVVGWTNLPESYITQALANNPPSRHPAGESAGDGERNPPRLWIKRNKINAART